MKVVISEKTSNLDVHGESIRKQVAAKHIDPEHLHRLETDHRAHQKSKDLVYKLLAQFGIEFQVVHRRQYWPRLDEVDAVITLGGDGTLLEASHHIDNESLPIFGICSSPMSVGYLCTCDYTNLEQAFKQFSQNLLQKVYLRRLRAKVTFCRTGGEVTTEPSLNDFLFAHEDPAATTRYRISVGQETEMHKSSGIWVATAAGSSAAIQAAGGEVFHMTFEQFQFKVRELYAPPGKNKGRLHSGLFDAEKKHLIIENLCTKAILAIDGYHDKVVLSFGDKISFVPATNLAVFHFDEEQATTTVKKC
ncbi:MAG: NAD(+)/NADH kinase [Zetaproteobacteria bacterium]|nr:NAD(+)/NADH kinase [Zetaproteobacteria bacterium]